MTMWLWILIACTIAFGTKLIGYLLPEKWLERPWVLPVSHGVTVGLLASLVATSTFANGQQLTFDARVAALLAAAVALKLRAPYLVVVIVGAAAAAVTRLIGFA